MRFISLFKIFNITLTQHSRLETFIRAALLDRGYWIKIINPENYIPENILEKAETSGYYSMAQYLSEKIKGLGRTFRSGVYAFHLSA